MNDFIIEKNVLIKYDGTSKDVFIPSGVEKIADEAIDLSKINALFIPKTVKKVGSLGDFHYENNVIVYEQFKKLNLTVYFEHNLSEYCKLLNDSSKVFNQHAKVMIKKNRSFIHLQSLKEIAIPNNITYLEDQFCYCNVERVIFGKNLKTIFNSFLMCKKLKKVIFNDKLTKLGEECFSDCVSLGPILKLPQSVIRLDDGCFRSCNNLKIIYANTKKLKIHSAAFYLVPNPVKILNY